MGGTKEEEEQGAVVEVIRKPDPQLGFKGSEISAVLIDQSGILLVLFLLE